MLEISAENPGTIVLKITNKDRSESEYVEIGTLNLVYALLAIGNHDIHTTLVDNVAYKAMQNRAVREYYKNHNKEKK